MCVCVFDDEIIVSALNCGALSTHHSHRVGRARRRCGFDSTLSVGRSVGRLAGVDGVILANSYRQLRNDTCVVCARRIRSADVACRDWVDRRRSHDESARDASCLQVVRRVACADRPSLIVDRSSIDPTDTIHRPTDRRDPRTDALHDDVRRLMASGAMRRERCLPSKSNLIDIPCSRSPIRRTGE